MTCGIYQIVNKVNGKRYVGSSVDIDARWRNHRYQLSNGGHHSVALQRAWNKYGGDSFSFEIIVECVEDEVLLREQLEIDKKSEYNILPTAGSNKGHKWTEEQKARHSENKIQYYADNMDVRLKISESARESHSRDWVRELISVKTKEGQSCPEVRMKMSAARKAQWTDDSYRSKMSEMARANINRPEHKGKLIEANTGKNNNKYNHTVYTFYHDDHGYVGCTQNELRKKYGLRSSNLSQVCSGEKGSHMGWKVKRGA